jgi:tetratricopeptide (TPR) repeat protein
MAVMTDTHRLEELKRRIQRDPASISFAGLAEEYRRLGLFAEAVDTCRAGLLRHPMYISARVTLGRALVELGEYDEASTELEQVLRNAPENLAAIRALADIHRRRGEMSERMEAEDLVVEPPEPHVPVPEAQLSAPVRIAVSFAKAAVDPAPPALVELEAFLAAIGRARRDVAFEDARQ